MVPEPQPIRKCFAHTTTALVLFWTIETAPWFLVTASGRPLEDLPEEPAEALVAVTGAAPVGALLKDPPRLAAWIHDHNRDVAVARAKVRQASADLGQSGVIPNPEFNFTVSNLAVGQTTPPGIPFKELPIMTFGLSETIELGKRGPRQEAARLMLQSEYENYVDALAQTLAEARLALGRVAHLRAKQGVLQETLDGANAVLKLERKRVDQGDLAGNDYDRLVLDTMGLESDVAQNHSDYQGALATCRAVMAAPCDPSDADEAILRTVAPVPALPEGTDALLEGRPDVVAARLERDASQQSAILAERRAIPDPNLGLAYTQDMFTVSGDNPHSFMVSLTFPLPAFDHGQHDAAKARCHASEMDLAAAATLEQAEADLDSLQKRKAYLDGTLEMLNGRAIPTSKAVLDSTTNAFHRGQLSMTDLLLARRTHMSLVTKSIDLQFEAFNVRNDLRRTLGLDAKDAREME